MRHPHATINFPYRDCLLVGATFAATAFFSFFTINLLRLHTTQSQALHLLESEQEAFVSFFLAPLVLFLLRTQEAYPDKCLYIFSRYLVLQDEAQRFALPAGRRAKIKLREQITAIDKIMLGMRTVPTSQVDALLGFVSILIILIWKTHRRFFTCAIHGFHSFTSCQIAATLYYFSH